MIHTPTPLARRSVRFLHQPSLPLHGNTPTSGLIPLPRIERIRLLPLEPYPSSFQRTVESQP